VLYNIILKSERMLVWVHFCM